MRYLNREQAGQKLADYLIKLGVKPDLIIGLPRGGLITGLEVAEKLKTPMDYVLVKKIGPPGNPEYAIAVIAIDGEILKGDDISVFSHLAEDYLKKTAGQYLQELELREQAYRLLLPKQEIKGKLVLVVDDGLATGLTVEAVVDYLYREGAREVLVAAPVSSNEAVEKLKDKTRDVYTLYTPAVFYAVGEFYEEFYPVSEELVADILKKARTI